MQSSLRQAELVVARWRLSSVVPRALSARALSFLVPAFLAVAATQTWFRPGTFIAAGDVPPFFRTDLMAEWSSLWGHALSGGGSASFQASARAPELVTLAAREGARMGRHDGPTALLFVARRRDRDGGGRVREALHAATDPRRGRGARGVLQPVRPPAPAQPRAAVVDRADGVRGQPRPPGGSGRGRARMDARGPLGGGLVPGDQSAVVGDGRRLGPPRRRRLVAARRDGRLSSRVRPAREGSALGGRS